MKFSAKGTNGIDSNSLRERLKINILQFKMPQLVISYLVVATIILVSCERSGDFETPLDNDGYWTSGESQSVSYADGTFEEFGLACVVQSVEQDDEPFIRMTIVNDSDAKYEILKWRTAWDDYYPIFEVNLGPLHLDYQGIRAVREEPREQDYVSIEPQTEVSVDYDLSKHVHVDFEAEYDVSLAAPTFRIRKDGVFYNLAHDCGDGRVALGNEFETVKQGLWPKHDECTDWQADRIWESNSIAWSALNLAYDGFTGYDNGLYREWFGDYSSSNMDHVRAQLRDIIEAKWGWWVRCGSDYCDSSGAVAYVSVITGLEDKLFVCSPFFESNRKIFSGNVHATRAGTLVHEASHVRDSEEWAFDKEHSDCSWTNGSNACYGPDNARKLAEATCKAGSSCKAMKNASNYEQFVQSAYAAVLGSIAGNLLLL